MVVSRRRFLATLTPLAAVVLVACGQGGATGGFGSAPRAGTSGLVARPAVNEWPREFVQAAPEVQEAYRYALANPDVLQYMPCFCGCVNQGHTSNKDCYIQRARSDGSFVLEPMSFG